MVFTFEGFGCRGRIIRAAVFWELLEINFASDHCSIQLLTNNRAVERV